MLSTTKIGEFRALYGEFVREYLLQPRGQDHLRRYQDGRVHGRRNFEEITAETRRTGVPTDAVLLKLLPHTDTAAHRKSGAWIHIAPAIQGDIKNWFEKAKWTRAGDWPNIASAIVAFVARCVDNPSTIEAACIEFVNLPYTTGFQTGMLTPILNALDPDEFMIVNNKSRSIVNHLTDGAFKQRLTDYPATNSAARRVVNELQPLMHEVDGNDAPPGDLFDMFCHWLVAEKKESPFYGRERTVLTPSGGVTVVVPHDEEDAEDEAAPEVRTPEARQSLRIQAKLADIGAIMGFSVWLPRGDRGRVHALMIAKDPKALLDDLPLNYDETTLDTIEQIDVLWLKGRSIARAFEVEHATAVYSGLLRMADLLALQPNMDIRLHIVAPEERREKVFREMKRPVFSLLDRGPLSRSCTFISYESVESIRDLGHLAHTNDSIITEYEEPAEG